MFDMPKRERDFRYWLVFAINPLLTKCFQGIVAEETCPSVTQHQITGMFLDDGSASPIWKHLESERKGMIFCFFHSPHVGVRPLKLSRGCGSAWQQVPSSADQWVAVLLQRCCTVAVQRER